MGELNSIEFEVSELNYDKFGRYYEKLMEACSVRDLHCDLEKLKVETKEIEIVKNKKVVDRFDKEYTTYKLEYEIPEEERYEIVGVLSPVGDSNILDIQYNFKQYLEDEEYNIAIPDEVYEIKLECEHCGSGRRCNKTFLIFDFEDDLFFQVAEGCLTAYIYTIDKESVERRFEDLKYDDDYEEKVGSGNYNRRGLSYFNLNELVKHSLSHFLELEELEFVSRFKATPTNKSSVEKVKNCINGGMTVSSTVTDEMVSEFIETLTTNGTFDQEMIDIFLKENLVPEFKSGYVIYQAYAYLKNLLNPVEEEEEESTETLIESNHVGEIGEKIEVEVTYERKVDYTAEFREMQIDMTMYFFRTVDGDVLIWNTQKYLEVKQGDRFTLKGKVKQHNEYNDVKQTFVSYVKLSEQE